MTAPLIVADALSKRFFATQALDGVSFEVRGGEVHALVGENGAGKSTLIKILAGVLAPDAGRVLVAGEVHRFRTPREALAAGLVLIPQELRLVPALSVAENVMLGHLPGRRALGLVPTLDRCGLQTRARAALDRLGFTPALEARVDTLPYAERQLVAIAKALSHAARVLILDEPTAALEQREVRRLFEAIAALKGQGVAIVYISHRLEEVLALADRCTVLRDGRTVAVVTREAFDLTELIRDMTGRDVERSRGRPGRDAGPPLLEAEGVELREREVLGLAGLLGSGAATLLRGLFGAGPRLVTACVQGRPVALRRPAAAVRAGIGLVPGERATGLVLDLSVRDNILLPVLSRMGRACGLWLDRPAADRLVAELVEALDIRPRDPARRARELSGGNQQKVVFAKWLATRVAVLLLEEPTQGVDVSAKGQIHNLIRRFADEGGGVLFASADVDEVLSESDRVLALRHGRIVARLERGERFNERELRTALGG